MRHLRSLALVLVVAGCARATRPKAAASKHEERPAPTASADASAPGPPAPADLASYGYGRRQRRDPSDLCEPVEENLARAEKAITTADRSNALRASSQPWDHKTPPKYLDIVDRRYVLTSTEKSMLAKSGFVVPARLATPTYAGALHEIYQSQLPIYISSDAILHAIFKGNDAVLMDSERTLLPRLETALATMHQKLREGGRYPSEVKDDLDIYLTVARALLAEPENAKTQPDPLPAAQPLIESARNANEGLKTVQLFGRPRVIDWSQFTPRGHYAGDWDLERYFRGTMWLSRLELNLVSRSSRSSQPGFTPDPSETPREAVDALALADLADVAGVLPELDRVEHVWTEFAGKREDVSLDDLIRLRRRAGITNFTIPDSAEKLKAAIGNDFQRTARIHYMPQGSKTLPVISTMLGPRIVPDSQVETDLVHSRIPDRPMPMFGDIAFMLGHERAKSYLAPELARFPGLQPALEKGRTYLQSIDRASLYTAWLAAIRDVAVTPDGVLPSFTKTTAYSDMKLSSVVAAYGQLRHNYVLIAGQAYDEGGCEIPDGYVEPNLALYESLVAYAQRGRAAVEAMNGSQAARAYFERLERTLKVLISVVKDELAGRALSDEEKRWLAMSSEIVPPSSDGPGSNDGWYFNLFPHSEDAFSEHAFVGDWFTSSNASAVVYAGAREPRLGIFVVDVNGEPRVMVGPVARAFEHVGSLEGRLTDKDANKIGSLREPWAASYTAPEAPFPPVAILGLWSDVEGEHELVLRSSRDVGPITVELLDHHRVPVGKGTLLVGTTWKKITVKAATKDYVSVIRLRQGEQTREISESFGSVGGSVGGMKALEWDDMEKVRQRFQKTY